MVHDQRSPIHIVFRLFSHIIVPSTRVRTHAVVPEVDDGPVLFRIAEVSYHHIPVRHDQNSCPIPISFLVHLALIDSAKLVLFPLLELAERLLFGISLELRVTDHLWKTQMSVPELFKHFH